MVDEELKAKIKEKIESESFGIEDIMDYMNLLCQFINEVDEIRDEMDDPTYKNFIFHFYVEGMPYFSMIVEDLKARIEPNVESKWNAMVKINAENFAGLISGQKDGKNLYMNQELEAHGGLPAMVKFQTIIQLALEQLGI